MKVTDFMHEMRQTSAVMGRNSNVSVQFSGEEAYTDGNIINLPSLDMSATLTNEQVRAMRGYVDHEAGHVRHSDMPRIIDFYKRCLNNGKEDLKHIHNAVEDVWMEQKVLGDYPGSWKNLKQVQESLSFKAMEQRKKTGESFEEVNWNNIMWATVCHNPIYDGGEYNEKNKELFGDKINEWCKKFAEEAMKCSNSEETIELAKSIYKLLEEDPNLSESKPEDFDPKSGADMEEGEPGNTTEEQAMADINGKPNDKAGKEKGQQKGRAPSRKEGLTVDAHNEVGGIGGMDGPLKGKYRVFSTENDTVYKRNTSHPNYADEYLVDIVNSSDTSKYSEVKAKISSNVLVMKTKLKRALLAKKQRDWDFGRETGRLDTKRLVGAYRGDQNVYKQRIDRQEEDTSITILVDLSGSMGGSKARVARDCAVALSECLEGSMMPFKVVGFSNKRYPKSYRRYNDCGDRTSEYHRYERLDTVVFKDYDTPLKKCCGSVARIDEAIGGNNSDYDFIQNEISILKKRQEGRKVLFVLSDGHPAHKSDSSTSEIMELCNKATKDAKREGVECIGIGICDSSVKKIYDDSVVVHDIGELSSTVFNKLTKLLVG